MAELSEPQTKWENVLNSIQSVVSPLNDALPAKSLALLDPFHNTTMMNEHASL